MILNKPFLKYNFTQKADKSQTLLTNIYTWQALPSDTTETLGLGFVVSFIKDRICGIMVTVTAAIRWGGI